MLRIDIRRSKRGRIIESFWRNSFNPHTRKNNFIEIYQYFGKRLIKFLTHIPILHNNETDNK